MKNDVLEQVETLSSVLEETAAGAQEVSTSTQEVNEASRQFITTSQTLNKASEELEGKIICFKF